MRRALVALLLLAAAPAEPRFDATAAWGEFTTLLRTSYGYFQRPGVDGEAILKAFEARATAASDRAAFVDVLQRVAANFNDPHFVVGPFTDDDYGVIPTAGDLHAARKGGVAEIVAVRDDSAAGLRRGDRITNIEGGTVDAAIARACGRPVAVLSAVQADYCLDMALAGVWKQPRRITLAGAGERALPATVAMVRRVAALPPLTIERRGGAAVIRVNNSLGRNETIAAFKDALAGLADAPVLVIDLRNTPSGGNTTVARGIMGHFVDAPRPYQMHVIPSEERQFGVPRRFVEYVMPIAPRYRGRVVVLGGHWTGSMGEGLMIGFDAIGVPTAGSRLGGLLGALSNEVLPLSGARVDIGEEQLFHVDGSPREDFRPRVFRAEAEARGPADPLLDAAIAAARRPRG
ncbi:S41 family peptidase [Glacieibacterium frigidum]|uniref:Uncharacterized protein n=1 Tax=Glacieibacterium frigidum TaxID=2593303 RepID=A0A552UAF1_9SPHN|nr:S41 family peptidase [Glacieibacterium frigidum]TRW15200.1 hypothetical protein FMM06_16325 [Glacieibacterium frigidum]